MLKKENIMIIEKRKKQAVKKRYEDKKRIHYKQYEKENYVENGTSNIIYQKARHQENPELQLVHIENIATSKIQRIT